ncbi:methyltransferase domain-containing protein [bacterium]|nr:methyltransferase domain-containing protein [bacterium]
MQAAREAMIDTQVRPNDVTDRRVIAALALVPREMFLPAERRGLAYVDAAVDYAPGRSIQRARDYSKLLQAAEIGPDDCVLDVASGTGYTSAVLSRLARHVVAVEDQPDLVEIARARLADLQVLNVDIVVGPLSAGAPAAGPFDVVVVNGAVEEPAAAWSDQLAEGGRLAVVVSEGPVKRARIYTKAGGVLAWRTPFEASTPVLPGFERVQRFRF